MRRGGKGGQLGELWNKRKAYLNFASALGAVVFGKMKNLLKNQTLFFWPQTQNTKDNTPPMSEELFLQCLRSIIESVSDVTVLFHLSRVSRSVLGVMYDTNKHLDFTTWSSFLTDELLTSTLVRFGGLRTVLSLNVSFCQVS
jgi:hypothetical protein